MSRLTISHKEVLLHICSVSGSTTITLLQIYCWVCWWKNFESRQTLGEITGKKVDLWSPYVL